jgi:CheY-like chemotaxis protein
VKKTRNAHEVLVVEDDAAVRESIAEILEDNGYIPVPAANGREALDRLRALEDKPCLILLDIMMPVMDGREFRSHQQSDPELGDIPVIVLSAHANVEDTARAMDVTAALRKPIELDTLLAVLQQHCDPLHA